MVGWGSVGDVLSVHGVPPSDVIRWRSVGRAAFWALRERAPFIDGRARFRGWVWLAQVEYTARV